MVTVSAIGAGLDKIQAKAEAAAAQLNLSDDEINTRVAEQEDKLTGIFTKTDACRMLADFLRAGRIKGI